eukprot:11780459-Alexandrium_andersonii.AAC.1
MRAIRLRLVQRGGRWPRRASLNRAISHPTPNGIDVDAAHEKEDCHFHTSEEHLRGFDEGHSRVVQGLFGFSK